jgi:hypothetical protein
MRDSSVYALCRETLCRKNQRGADAGVKMGRFLRFENAVSMADQFGVAHES